MKYKKANLDQVLLIYFSIAFKGALRKFNDSQKRKFVSKGGGGVNARCLTFRQA